jgi:hypothetical protein
MTILPGVFMPYHTYRQLWGDYRISAPAAGSSPRDGDGMAAPGPERRLLPAPTWSRLGATQTPLEVARMTRLTHSGLSGTDFAAMQQAALAANREVKQATESFINNVYNRRHWIAVTGRTIDHCGTR